MTQEQKEQLTYILYTLQMNINDKSTTYEHSVEDSGIVTNFEISREHHLEEVMRWVAQEIEREFGVLPIIEQ
ncbi:pathogenicity island protein [Staphylococcus succinus]|nr:pathogenicity island protein [Staphylococcus succinus]